MSVVIVGGNECMVRQYKELCQAYQCSAKVFAKSRGSLHNKVGTPDLLVLFTSTMSHRMVRSALSETRGSRTVVARSRTSSMAALRGILEQHTGGGGEACQKIL
ncbi:MAG: DUF2325 domain-containing protein [Clostridiales bacterium]|uniref:DUF2325 domain-containing protein n=1 Tax=Dysosmobacter welbionis TaxID=2093857 RepID=UPI000D7A9334|nr:MAG: DUF2325 domain-containing protein [Clostridiales bacterium]